MDDIDQSRFNHRDKELISAQEAAELLGVRRATLYTYASRGWLHSHPDPASHRQRRYLRGEVERLRLRAAARRGHAPVAAAALRWGDPVIDTSICSIDASGLRYRGRDAIALASEHRFEEVMALLWETGPAPSAAQRAGDPASPTTPGTPLRDLWPADLPLVDRLLPALPWLALRDPARHAVTEAGLPAQARHVYDALLRVLGAPPSQAPLAQRLARLLDRHDAADDLDIALILCAEHELNASAFAARVAASAGASLYDCLQAALATHSGPRHGGASDRVEALLAQLRAPSDAPAALGAHASAGRRLPGLGHPLYPAGDPRFPPLAERARQANGPATGRARLERGLALLEVARRLGHPPPNLDFGLNLLTAAWDLPPGSARLVFALGRMAGWVAHVIEQRRDGRLLRPRARYTVEPPG